jgi:hypothetical protein
VAVREEQQEEASIPAAIEHKAGQRDQYITPAQVVSDGLITDQKRAEKNNEDCRIKQHGLRPRK